MPWLISAIVVLGLFLRVWGISFGLPDLYHADEPIVVNHAMAYGSGDLNPHFFKIPPLASYLLFGIFGVYFLFGQLLGVFHGVEGFMDLFLSDPSSFYLLGRVLLGALPGTLTCLLLYRLGKRFFSVEAGFAAAFWLAVNFLHVRDSHFIYADIPLLMILVSAFFPILRISGGGKRADYLIFGALAGAAVAMKYNGVFVFVPFFAAHFLGRGIKGFFSLDAYLAGIFSIAVFFVLNPFSLIDSGSFFGELLTQSDAEGFTGHLHHFTYSLCGALGIPLAFLLILSLVYAAARREAKRLTIVSFLCVYYFVLIYFSQHYDRYVLPLIPFSLLLAAECLRALMPGRSGKNIMFAVLVILIALPPAVKAVRCDDILSQEDVRTGAKKWVEAHIPAGSRIALDVPFFVPRLKLTAAQLEKKREQAIEQGAGKSQLLRLDSMLGKARARPEDRYELYFLGREERGFLFASPKVPYDVEACKARGIAYVIVAKISPGFNPDFYEELQNSSELVARFTPYRDPSRKWPIDNQPLTGAPFLWDDLFSRERNGQTIEIYRLR